MILLNIDEIIKLHEKLILVQEEASVYGTKIC